MELLVLHRLLVTDVVTTDTSGPVIELPAVVLRNWVLLRGWLDADSVALGTLEGAKRSAHEWVMNNKRNDWLVHSGARLQDAEAIMTRPDLVAALGPDERAYLSGCRKVVEIPARLSAIGRKLLGLAERVEHLGTANEGRFRAEVAVWLMSALLAMEPDNSTWGAELAVAQATLEKMPQESGDANTNGGDDELCK